MVRVYAFGNFAGSKRGDRSRINDKHRVPQAREEEFAEWMLLGNELREA